MKWIVGLGNPGNPYAGTRHNVGFMAVDRCARRWGIDVGKEECRAVTGSGIINGVKTVLVKPMTYMNLSGEAVHAFLDYYQPDLADLIVLYDDLDTNFGQIRLRYKGGPGGHNGIKSIIQHTGTKQFCRIRIGISRPPAVMDTADYVLGRFGKEEGGTLDEVLERTADALEQCLTEPFEKVMARFN